MNKKHYCNALIISLTLLLGCPHTLFGQQVTLDSLSLLKKSVPMPKESFVQKNPLSLAVVPAAFFTASALTWGERKNIRAIRNRYIPDFTNHYDDYLQWAPTATVYGLKLAGVKGRNNIGRATLSYAASLGIMAILVNGIKYTARVERPDGSTKNSFPSGHTATAFTNATFMHKEYGLVNPLYSIGAYGMSTFTGVGRELNNRHWVSDVLAGAGIGILSTQLAYFFIDKIYKNNGDNMSILSRYEGSGKPSFLSLKMGYTETTQDILGWEDDKASSRVNSGFETGVEGAYYFNNHWGVGGDFSFASFTIEPSSFLEDLDEKYSLIAQSIGSLNFSVGPYYATTLGNHWLFQAKVNAGVALGSKGSISWQYLDKKTGELEEEELFTYKPKNTMRVGTGVSMTYKINPGIGLTAYVDYAHSNPEIVYSMSWDEDEFGQLPLTKSVAKTSLKPVTRKTETYETTERAKIDYFTFGLRLTAFF